MVIAGEALLLPSHNLQICRNVIVENQAFLLLLLTLIAGSLASMGQSHFPGEFFVMFHQQQDAEKWGAQHGLEHLDVLSPRAHIHWFKLDQDGTSAQDWAVLRKLREDKRVEAAQFNHEVSRRETLPNDPQIGQPMAPRRKW